MAITVNGDRHPFRDGMTVEDLMVELKFSWPLKTVFIGERRVPREEYATTDVHDGDEIRVIHLMAGG